MKFEEVTINSMEDFLLLAKRQQWQVVLNYRDRCQCCGSDRNEVLIQDDDPDALRATLAAPEGQP